MHCTTTFFRSADRVGGAAPGPVVRPQADPRGDRDSVSSIDSQTTWPTHRIRWYLSLQEKLERGATR